MTKIPYPKQLISFPDQIALLKQRGLVFTDETKALHLLRNISYYRLSGYWYPLLADKQNHLFKPGSTFDAAYNIYKFDSELRKLIITELGWRVPAQWRGICYSFQIQVFWSFSTKLDNDGDNFFRYIVDSIQ